MGSRLKQTLMRSVLPPVARRVMQLLGETWRHASVRREILASGLASDRPLIGAFFHGRLIPFLDYMSRPGNGPWRVMISNSADGDLLASMVRGLGFRTVRGSSGEGGIRAIMELIRVTRREPEWPVGVAVDGSRGPRGRVQTGVILLAQKTNALIMPAAVSSRGAYVLRRSWERSIIPRPFSRVYVGFGELMEVPRRVDADELERCRLRLERALLNLHAELDRLSGFRDTAPLQAPLPAGPPAAARDRVAGVEGFV